MKPNLFIYGASKPRQDEVLEKHFTIHRATEMADPVAFFKENGGDIKYVMTNGHDGFKNEHYDLLPNLKVISSFGVGYDMIDAEYAAKQGVVVTHTPNVLNADVANTAIMMLLAISRRLVPQEAWARSGSWAQKGDAPLTTSIEGKPVGIVGLGRIGKAIGEKLSVFDCVVNYHSRTKKDDVSWTYFADLTELAKAVDYLIVITPGGPETEKLINADVMNALGPDGTLINLARGSVVDETALIESLKSGKLGAAALDVFENEPNIPAALCEMENVLLLPHVGSATVETRNAMADLVVNNLVAFEQDGKAIAAVPECAHL